MNAEPRPSLRQEQKELTRTRLLDAAVEVLGNDPAMQGTMESIARSAGVTRATLYAHFESKTDIIRALAERLHALGDEVYASLAEIPVWTPMSFRRWLDALVERWHTEAVPIRLLVIGATGSIDGSALAPHQRYVRLLTADRERWASVPPAEAEQRALMFLLLIESFLTAWIAGKWPLGTDDPVAPLSDALGHILQPALRPDTAT